MNRRQFLQRTAALLAATAVRPSKALVAVSPAPLLPPPLKPSWLEDGQEKARFACITNPTLARMIDRYNQKATNTPLPVLVEQRWAEFHWAYHHSPEHRSYMEDIWSRFGTGPSLLAFLEKRYAEDVAHVGSLIEGW